MSSLVAQVTRASMGARQVRMSPSGSSVCWMRMVACRLSEIQRPKLVVGDYQSQRVLPFFSPPRFRYPLYTSCVQRMSQIT